jgi:hypothetical protein
MFYSIQLAPNKYLKQIEILLGLLFLKNIFRAKILDLDTKIKQENKSIQKIKKKKKKEIKKRQKKIICFHEFLE